MAYNNCLAAKRQLRGRETFEPEPDAIGDHDGYAGWSRKDFLSIIYEGPPLEADGTSNQWNPTPITDPGGSLPQHSETSVSDFAVYGCY
jgi:hypothetical protein